MTTLHARRTSRPALSTNKLRRRTGRAPVEQMFADLEQQITAYRAREQRRKRQATFFVWLPVVLFLLAVVLGLYATQGMSVSEALEVGR